MPASGGQLTPTDLEHLVDELDAVVWRATTEPEVRFTFISAAAERVLGHPVEAFLEPGFWERTIHPEDQPAAIGLCAESTRLGEDHVLEYRWIRGDGEVIWVRDVVRVADDGESQALYGVMVDVTEQRRREERLQLLLDNSHDCVYRYRLAPEPGYEYISPSIEALTGHPAEDWYADPTLLMRVIHPDDRAALEAQLDGGEPAPLLVLRWRRPDGRVVWVETSQRLVRDAEGVPIAMEGVARDVTERVVAEEGSRVARDELAHRALHDALTGLPNRRLFHDRLAHALVQRSDTTGRCVAVLFADLDDLKAINDTHGHAAGDAVIRETGRRLVAAVRPGDTVGRLGGDEFTVLCPSMPDADAVEALGRRIVASLEAPVELETGVVPVTLSIGAAVAAPTTRTPDELLGDADVALLHAKQEGKARVEIFDDRLGDVARGRRRREVEVRDAAAAGQFELHYQPILELETGRAVAVEALVRWSHPSRGLLPPSEFIDVADRLGVLGEIGRWVVERACRDRPAFREADCVSVNMSPGELASPTLVDEIGAILSQTGVDGGELCIEITESGIVEDPASALRTLRGLKSLGCRISLDDFGKGFSSLGQLTTFPVDTIKLDRLFVAEIETSRRSLELVAAVRSMAEALGVDLVAEGIETEGQRAALLGVGCRLGQGFLLGRPAPLAAVRL